MVCAPQSNGPPISAGICLVFHRTQSRSFSRGAALLRPFFLFPPCVLTLPRSPHQNTPRNPSTSPPSHHAPRISHACSFHNRSATATHSRARHPYSTHKNKCETFPAFSCHC